ncbi:MAG: chromate transporter [Firmicutes bacterium]|nr:chromate transporter [Bacillota bacterium]
MSKRNLWKENICFQLFFAFFKLGLFTIGGGMAMVPLIQGIVVDEKKWMSEEEAVDCIAVSQGLPGVIAINMATYIGKKQKGLIGAFCATVGVILPSFLIIILVVELLETIGNWSYLEGALDGIKAAVTGLIAFSVYKVGKNVLKGPFQWVLAVGTVIVVAVFRINAVFAILAGMVLGIVYTSKKERKKEVGGESK